jgi:hypothetical protein
MRSAWQNLRVAHNGGVDGGFNCLLLFQGNEFHCPDQCSEFDSYVISWPPGFGSVIFDLQIRIITILSKVQKISLKKLNIS